MFVVDGHLATFQKQDTTAPSENATKTVGNKTLMTISRKLNMVGNFFGAHLAPALAVSNKKDAKHFIVLFSAPL